MKPINIKRSLSVFVAALSLSMMAVAAPPKLTMATDSGAKNSAAGDALEHWAQLIEENSANTPEAMNVDIFYQNELGNSKEIFDLFVAGEVDLMLNWPVTTYDERMGLKNIPYLFFTWEQALNGYSQGGWLFDIYSDIHAGLGLKYFGAWPEGFAGVATHDRYATSIADASGLTVRVPPMFPMAQTMQAIGYSATSIAWGEVYTSLQTGVVDGDAGNIIYWDYEYFRDVLDYYVRTRHTFVTGVLSMNMETWESLSGAQQEIVSEAADAVSVKQFAEARALDQHYVELAEQSGMEYIELNDAQVKELATAAREKVWPLVEDKFGKEIMEQVVENAPSI